MASEIQAKFGATTALTITLASLGSSTSGVGRQSTMVDNSSTLYQKVHVFLKIKTGGSQTANKGIYVYLLKADKTSSPNVITDGAGATDAALTVVSADQVAGAFCAATTAQTYQFNLILNNPGPSWGIAVVHDTNANLDSTAGNHAAQFVGENPNSV